LFFLGWEGPKFTSSRAGGPKGLKQHATFCALQLISSWDIVGSTERINMAKKEFKPEYQPGGAKRHVIIDKAVKYLVEFPGLQSDKMHFLLDEIGLSTTEYLEALNRATNGELVKTALGD